MLVLWSRVFTQNDSSKNDSLKNEYPVVKETFPGERRVALIPQSVGKLLKAGCEVSCQSGAGAGCRISDDAYRDAGATIASTRDDAFKADIILQVRTLGANPRVGADDLTRLGPGKTVIGSADPLGAPEAASQMAETGAPLAGEMSAHIFFKHRYFGYDDAAYAAVRLLSIIAQSDDSLADMRDRLPEMINTPELRFDCAEDRKFTVIEEVAARLAKATGVEVNDIDGVRVTNEDGWWLLRASNTQAVLVARCESATTDGLDRLKAALVGQLEASGLQAPDFD